MKGKFLAFMLIINLGAGSYLGYLLTVTPEGVVPDEFVGLAVSRQSEASTILSGQILSQLEKFETQALGTSALLDDILLNKSYIPSLPSYYHDRTAVVQLDLSELPPSPFVSEAYGIEISVGGSAYKIVPDTFFDDYEATYLETGDTDNPFNQIQDDVKSEIQLTAKLDHILPSLYDLDPNTVWIEYTSEKGYSRSFPWSSVPQMYDGRQSSWYSSASTGAKDVIILLDKSGSMEGERKLGAVNATKNIISSLGGRDRFNILTFSDEIASFSDALSLVGEDNQLAAFDFLDRMVTGGTTNYDLAFTEGLDRLNRFGSDRRTPVVVFITDGAPTIGTRDNNTLIEKIQQANGPVGAQFVLFGISSETDHQLLSEIANEMGGANIRINTTEQIEGAISNYQDFLSLNKQAVISWSLPYLDTNGQGLVITTSIPLIVNSQLRGVISVDIRLETLVEFIVQDQLSENSYSYVFDIAGNSIVHPDVDLNTSTAETIRQPITQLEVDTEEFGELLSLAQKDQAVTQLLDYNGQDTLVSFTPIGNTSMILGMTTPLTDLIPDEVEAKINSLAINTLAFVPGVALGLLGALIMIVLRGRLLREDAPQIVAESPQNSKEEEA